MVLVVGAGIAGLSAALEAEAQGARVTLLEAASVGGGHAIKAGGFSMVDTGLQRSRGIQDSPQLAWKDIQVWAEDPDPYWTPRYMSQSAEMVYDWLTGMGVEFVDIYPTPVDSVPRFHFTRGRAVHVVVPMLRKIHGTPRIRVTYDTAVTRLLVNAGRVTGVLARNLQDGETHELSADAVILATGGFAGEPARILANWPEWRHRPDRLLNGAGTYALGSGLTLAREAGASTTRMDRHVIFVEGVPHPDAPSGPRGLLAQNTAAIYVDERGQRFMSEGAPDKAREKALLETRPPRMWMVFDEPGSRQLFLRDAMPGDAQRLVQSILDDPEITCRGESVDALSDECDLPLQATVKRWNQMIQAGHDEDFGRFGPDIPRATPPPITQGPFYAVRLYAMSRKTLGGIATDTDTRAVDATGSAIPGLYAVGESSGMAGINGSWGGPGTFLGPAVFLGRVAGRHAASAKAEGPVPERTIESPADQTPETDWPGSRWHYQTAHDKVVREGRECGECHGPRFPMAAASNAGQFLARLDTCTACH